MGEEVQRPTSDNDREGWKAYWVAQGMPWRKEPEIGEERQAYLAERRGVTVDIGQGTYPFHTEQGPITLTRADVEWLLATRDSESMHIPVDWADSSQRDRLGFDLRGANLEGVDLSDLPLYNLRAGLAWDEITRPLRPVDQALGTILIALVFAGLIGGVVLGSAMHAGWAVAVYGLAGVFLVSTLTVPFNPVSEQYYLLRRSSSKAWRQAAVNLSSATLVGTKLRSALLNGSTLTAGSLEGADLTDAQLLWSDLRRAHFDAKSTLQGVVFGRQRVGLYASYIQSDRAEFLVELGATVWAWMLGLVVATYNLYALVATLEASDHLQILARYFLPTAIFVVSIALLHLEAALIRWFIPDVQARYSTGARLADVNWGGANLSVIDWQQIEILGDEYTVSQRWSAGKKHKSWVQRRADYNAAMRAYRQLAKELQQRGMSASADTYFYRGHLMERQVVLREFQPLHYAGSWLLDMIAGYGYKPMRSVVVYAATILSFAVLYWCVTNGVSITHGLFTQAILQLGMLPPSVPTYHLQGYEAVVVSMTSFHGRGFFQPTASPGDKVAILSAIEAAVGLLIEIVFIATFTQRFFAR